MKQEIEIKLEDDQRPDGKTFADELVAEDLDIDLSLDDLPV